MYNPYSPSNVTHKYYPYNTHNSTTTGYNVPTMHCDTIKISLT